MGILRIVSFGAVAALVSLGGPVLSAGGSQKTTTNSVTCIVDFQPMAGDRLVGDGSSYADLSTNVRCSFNTTQGSANFGDMNMSLNNKTRGTTRYLRYLENVADNYAPYREFEDQGVLVVRNLLGANSAATDEPHAFVAYGYNSQFAQGAVRFRATADASTSGYPKPTDAPLVTRRGCSFTVSFSGSVDAWEGNGWTVFRGVYPLPFHFTARAKGTLPDGTVCQ